jgi:serine phosphatase RsbU (regulator of sigma subunit)
VGGDWYELYTLDDGRAGIVVGDVVGHGLEAAAAMGQLRAGFLALSTRTTDPAALLDELDVFACRHRITDFATAVCAVFDPRTGALHYANAGHPPMLLVTSDGSAVWLDDARATPLGTGLATVRPTAKHVVEPGSVLVMFTDGLVEDRHRPIRQGMTELAAVVTAQPLLAPDELCDVVLNALSPHHGFNDDVVVVCLRRLGT